MGKIKVVPGMTYNVLEGKIAPVRGKYEDAGLDLCIQEDLVVEPGEVCYAKAGVAFDLPQGYFGQVVSRSGTPKNHGVTVIPTIIDSNYKDEISTIFVNTSKETKTFKPGDRLGQIIICKYYVFENEDIETLRKGARDSHEKFGSTGK